MQISEIEKCAILNRLDGLPPKTWLNYSSTDGQKKHWESVSAKHQLLKKALEAYFSSDPTLLKHLEEKDQEYFAQLAECYITLYGALQWAWSNFVEAIEEIGIELRNLGVTTPGQMVVEILTLEAEEEFRECLLPHLEYKPRLRYNLSLKKKKVDQILSEKRSLNSEEQRTLRDFNANLASTSSHAQEFTRVRILCLNFCRAIAKNQNNKTLKRKLDEYDKQRESLYKLIQRINRTGRGGGWENGYPLETQKEGGSYRK